MQNKELTVIAILKSKPEMLTETKAMLLGFVELTRQEAGCIRYDLHQNISEPTTFIFYETWRSKEDLDLHLKMPYIMSGFAKAEQLLAQAPQIISLDKLA